MSKMEGAMDLSWPKEDVDRYCATAQAIRETALMGESTEPLPGAGRVERRSLVDSELADQGSAPSLLRRGQQSQSVLQAWKKTREERLQKVQTYLNNR